MYFLIFSVEDDESNKPKEIKLDLMKVFTTIKEFRASDSEPISNVHHMLYYFKEFDASNLVTPDKDFLDTFLKFLKKKVLISNINFRIDKL